MDLLHIAICDDNPLFLQEAMSNIKEVLERHYIPHTISIFETGESFIHSGFFDIVFLDIEMQGLNGIETAQKLREQGNNCRIIFLTSHTKYVFSAFDVSASHYLLKPIDVAKMETVLMKMVQLLTTDEESYYTLKCGTQVYRVPFSQIQYVEVFGRKISLHTTQDVFTFNGKLEEIEQAFPSRFFRCHKSYLVNLAIVMRYNKEFAVLQSGERIPIARRKFAAFGEAFLTFLQEEGA